MGVFPNGQGSYVGIGMQTGFGGAIVTSPLKTFPNIGGGDVVAPTAGFGFRQSIRDVMPRGSQTFKTMDLVNVSWAFEVVHDTTAFKNLITAGFGKRVNAANADDKFYVHNPLFDGGTDEAPSAGDDDYFNHTLSTHVFLTDGTNVAAKYVVKDVVITNFEWSGRANEATTMSFQGTGRGFDTSASSVAFADQTGVVLNWNDAIDATPKGIFVSAAANPPAVGMVCQSFRFALSQPHEFVPSLGAALGGEMRTPFRSSLPTAVLSVEQFFENADAGTDGVSILSAFIGAIKQNAQITYHPSSNNFIRLQASGSVAPGTINNPRVSWSNQGPVTFNWDMNIYPDVITDLFMEIASDSNT